MPEKLPFLTDLHTMIFDPDRIPFAVLAILLTLVVGVITGPRTGNANPMIWIWVDKMFGGIGDRLDKKERSSGDLAFRGFFVMVVAFVLFVVLGALFQNLALHSGTYGLLEVVLIALALSGGSVWYVLLKLYFALGKGQVEKGAFYAIARTSRINLNTTDDYGITRVGMALAARSFDKNMVAPVLWYLIGGLPAMFGYAALAAVAWRFGKDGFSKGLGSVPLAIEKLLGIVPSIFAALLMSFASVFTPTATIFKSFLSWAKKGAPYEQGGMPLTAMSYALEVTLGGPAKDIGGSTIKSDWVGPKNATAKVEPHHLRRAMYLNLMAQLLFVVALLGAYLWSGIINP